MRKILISVISLLLFSQITYADPFGPGPFAPNVDAKIRVRDFDDFFDSASQPTVNNALKQIAASYPVIDPVVFSDDLIPAISCTYDLGSSSLLWKDAYFNSTVTANGFTDGTLNITGGDLTTTGDVDCGVITSNQTSANNLSTIQTTSSGLAALIIARAGGAKGNLSTGTTSGFRFVYSTEAGGGVFSIQARTTAEVLAGTGDSADDVFKIDDDGDWYNSTNRAIFLGAAANGDIGIQFDNSDLVFDSLDVTANDEVHFTDFDTYVFDGPININLDATELNAIVIDGETTDLTTAGNYAGIYNARDIAISASETGYANYGLNNDMYNNHEIDGTPFTADTTDVGVYNNVTNISPHSATVSFAMTELNVGEFNGVERGGTVTTNKWDVEHRGLSNSILIQPTYNNGAGVVTSDEYCLQNNVNSLLNITDATSYTRNVYGSYTYVNTTIAGAGAAAATTTAYGSYVTMAGTADTNWIFYAGGSVGDSYLTDMSINDTTPHLTFRDTTDDTAYQWHLDESTNNVPWQNFGLWRGTDATGQDFSVNPNKPLIYWDNSNNMNIGNAPTGSRAQFEPDGTLEFQGDAIVWNELPPTPVTAAKLGSTAPTLAPFQGNVEQYTFDASNDFIIGATEITHAYKEGTTIFPHAHWATNGTDGTNRGVKWQLEYTIANYDTVSPFTEAFGGTVTLNLETTIPAGTADRAHIFTGLGSIDGSSLKIGGYIVWRFERIVAIGTAPTNDPFGLAVGFHVMNDTVGSREELTK